MQTRGLQAGPWARVPSEPSSQNHLLEQNQANEGWVFIEIVAERWASLVAQW